MTIIDALSRTGGFASLISLFCGTIARYFSKMLYNSSLIGRMYKSKASTGHRHKHANKLS